MDDALRMHVTNSLAYLPHEQDAIPFGQGEIIGHDAFKQFAAGNAVRFKRKMKTKQNKKKTF